MAEHTGRNATSQILEFAAGVERNFQVGRRVLSFSEYLELFSRSPVRYARDAGHYLRDMFLHYGTTKVHQPWGDSTRFNLFDLPWEQVPGGRGLARGALIGQEHVQNEIFRSLSNFVREGYPNRLVLLHGPNGSAKSTVVACIMAALEHYSTLDEGVLYRFNWVFPSQKTVRSALGFNAKESPAHAVDSYAHLSDDQIDAKLLVEVRDHPLFLVPVADRERLLDQVWTKSTDGSDKGQNSAAERPSDWIRAGQLSHKSQQVFEALLASYHGSYAEVLKHVQVERYFVSRRYRTAAITLGPQLSIDAMERQVTADRSLAALPASLQALTLYEARGELIEAAGGLLEFSDLLKRPLDAFKYLQLTIETGEIALPQQNVELNCVMIGSANELHLDAFRNHPEFASFRGRLELLRTPYLLNYRDEQAIYNTHIAPQVGRHVAPHATAIAAAFAVLTRMRKPQPDAYPEGLSAIVGGLTALEKLDLYAHGLAPERLEADAQKVLRANIKSVVQESDAYPVYEGRIGASPREMRVALLDAAQSRTYRCLSPLAVIEELDALCQGKNEFEWLQQQPLEGGYHDVNHFLKALHARLLTIWEAELYSASGFVDEGRYLELFDRYVQHVNVWLKKERFFNRATNQHEEADEPMMAEVERMLDLQGTVEDWRKQMMSAIAAWSLDHPDLKFDPAEIFPQYLRRIREAIYGARRTAVAALTRDVVIVLRDAGSGLDAARLRAAEAAIDKLVASHGYCRDCAGDMAGTVLRTRFVDLVV